MLLMCTPQSKYHNLTEVVSGEFNSKDGHGGVKGIICNVVKSAFQR